MDQEKYLDFKKIFNKIKLLTNSRFFVRRSIYLFIKKQTQNKKFNVLVDLGSGCSPYKKLFLYNKYIAIDVENRSGLDNVIIADINSNIPLDNNSADLILATEVLEHIKEPNFVLSEIYRILRPGGELILTTPFVWPLHEKPNDYFRYTRYGLGDLLSKNGFTDILIESRGGYFSMMGQLIIIFLRHKFFSPIIFIVNLFILLINPLEKGSDLALGYHVVATKR